MKAIVLLVSSVLFGADSQYRVYVGIYTGSASKGIYAFEFEAATGKAGALTLAAETASPSFLAIHPSKRFLFAVNETNNGMVSSFSIDPSNGKLASINSVSSKGASPCALAVDPTGHMVVAGNYSSGSLTAFGVGDDGRLGEAAFFDQRKGSSVDKSRQEGPHAHSTDFTPDGRFLLSADLGLDAVFLYRFDPASRRLSPQEPPFAKAKPGAGPRHIAIDSKGRFAYVINELSSTVAVYTFDAKQGRMTEIQSLSTLPTDFKGSNSTAEIAIHPSGRFLYASNRGHDSLAVYSIDRSKGTITLLRHVPTQGKTPRNFAIDPTGRWLLAANQQSNSVTIFKVDEKNGDLAPTGKFEAPTPVCLLFVQKGR